MAHKPYSKIKGHEFLPAGVVTERCFYCKLTRRLKSGRGKSAKYEYLVKNLDEYKRHPTVAPMCSALPKKPKKTLRMSDFGRWFKAQFGEFLPRSQQFLQDRVSSLRFELSRAEHQLLLHNAHFAQRDAALKGWVAAKTPKKQRDAAIRLSKRRG